MENRTAALPAAKALATSLKSNDRPGRALVSYRSGPKVRGELGVTLVPEWFALVSQAAGWTVGASLFAAAWRLSIVNWKLGGILLGWAPAGVLAMMAGILTTAFWAAIAIIAISLGVLGLALALGRFGRSVSLGRAVPVSAASAAR
jgi:hypothetical protein